MSGSHATSSDRRARSVVVAALLAILVAACVPETLTGTADRPDIHVSNGTTLMVTIVVNREAAGVVGPGDSATIPGAVRPDLPWVVQALSPSGRVLTTMEVHPGQVRETHWPDGRIESSGALGRADLSCGRLDVWVGASQPLGPAPGPGQPGDCLP
jgi:hypothetical protein